MIQEDRSVADELLAAAVRDATAALNRAMHAAAMAGLAVNVDERGIQEFGRRVPIVQITVTVARPL
jgi:uncharacterized membrane protein YadS